MASKPRCGGAFRFSARATELTFDKTSYRFWYRTPAAILTSAIIEWKYIDGTVVDSLLCSEAMTPAIALTGVTALA